MNNNIKLFDQFVGVIFARLYESFPVSKELDYSALPDECDSETLKLNNSSFNREVWRSPIKWLSNTGYISILEESDFSAMEATLTPKALEIMKSTPSSLGSKSKNIGDFFIENTKSGYSSALSKGVEYALSTGIRYITGTS